MTGPLLATKLQLPRLRREVVARPRLREHLNRVWQSALALVFAPAGFGKTTLLTEWLARNGRAPSTAWLSLDPRDNDPVMFWTYVVAAVQGVAPEVGAGALSLLRSPGSSVEDVLATLLNDLQDVAGDLVLVLDDYHLISAPQVHEAMTFLLEHLPAQVHLVIATRVDPALPLARWRARGDLVELRAADLRFTPEEAAQYLNDAMGLALTEKDVAASQRWTGAPRGGSLRCSWRRCRCRGATTSPASSRVLPATTGSSSATSSRRCCSANLSGSATSCCGRPS